MLPQRLRPVLPAVLVAAALAVPLARPQTCRADDEPPAADVAQPVVLVTLAGVERVLEDVEFVFGNVDRSDVTESVAGFLEGVNELKGLDRTKPIGLALYLAPGVVPQPLPVGFVPVEDVDDLLETAKLGPVTTKPVAGKPGRYEIDGGRRSLFAQVRDGYALVSNDETVLDRELASPVEEAKALGSRYDFAIAAYVENVPKPTRDFFLSLLRTSAGAELQQRDGEPDAQYRLRKANGKRAFELIEMLLSQGQRVVLGWDTSRDDRRAVLELSVDATPDSEFAKLMTATAGRPSLFTPAMQEDVPLSAAVSWLMDEAGGEMLAELFRVAETELAKQLAAQEGRDVENAEEPIVDEGVSRLMRPLIATAEARHVDGFLRMNHGENRRMVLVGGARLRDADDFAAALVPFLQRLSESDEIAEVTTSVDSAQGVAFHRVTGSNASDEDQRIYGEQPSLYIGAGRRAVWVAVGGEAALAELKATIEDVVTATPAEQAAARSPLRVVFHVDPWTTLPPRDGQGAARFRELVDESMSRGGDALRVDVRPTENGARLRVELEEGFLRMMGLGIARGMDLRQERFRERRERREREVEADERESTSDN